MAGSRSSENPIMIYLAGPIDGLPEDQAREWREAVGAHATDKVCFFSPAHAFLGTSEGTFPAVDFYNRLMIAHSEGVLANLKEGLSFGTIREIEFASQHSKPICVVGDLGASLMRHDLMVADSLEAGLLDLVSRIAELRDKPVTMFGMPLVQLRQVEPGEEDEPDGD